MKWWKTFLKNGKYQQMKDKTNHIFRFILSFVENNGIYKIVIHTFFHNYFYKNYYLLRKSGNLIGALP